MKQFKEWLASLNEAGREFTEPLSQEDEREAAKMSAIGTSIDIKSDGGRKWEVYARIHARSNAYVRVPQFSTEDWRKFFVAVANKVDTYKKMTKETEILFSSRSTKQSALIAVDPPKKQLRLVTVYAIGKDKPKAGTVRTIVEDTEPNAEELQYVEIE